MIFMHHAILSKCGCTKSMLLYIYRVFGRWGTFDKDDLERGIVEKKLKYVPILLEGIYVFYVFHLNVL